MALEGSAGGEHIFTAVRQSSVTESEANLHVANRKGGPLYGSALGQAVKFVHRQERPMLRSRAEVRPQPGRAIAAISLDGFFIAISSFGDWSKRPFRTRRRMDGRTILR